MVKIRSYILIILGYVRSKPEAIILTALVGTMIFFNFRTAARMGILETVVKDQEVRIEKLETGELPMIESTFRGQAVTYPLLGAMIARFDLLVNQLSKTASLSEDLLFFPKNGSGNPFQIQ